MEPQEEHALECACELLLTAGYTLLGLPEVSYAAGRGAIIYLRCNYFILFGGSFRCTMVERRSKHGAFLNQLMGCVLI